MKKLVGFLGILIGLGGFWACAPSSPESDFSDLITGLTKQFRPDKRVSVFDVDIKKGPDGKLRLTGETNLPEAHRLLLDSLAGLDYSLIDSVRVLPDTTVGNQVWGLVSLSVVSMRKQPDYAAEMVSQAILGTPVKLLDKQHGWYRVQSPDHYIGWVDDAGITAFTDSAMTAWKAADRYVYTPTYGYALAEAKEGSDPVSDLVLGSIVEVESSVNGFLKVRFPDKREGYLKASDCVAFSQWEQTVPDAQKVVATARKLFGTPYLWGGTSTKGVDCSGLIKTAYFSQGLILARDASQQARYGESLDVTKDEFETGDLLFFGRSKERITHVALYMGNNHYIHSSGRVKINSLDSLDSDFDPRRKAELVASSRVLNSLNTEQIIPVKNHPWYN